MHSILDPGPSLLEDACELVPYASNQPLDDDHIRAAAGGCAGILSQLMDPITDRVLSTPGLKIVSNVAVGFDNIDVAAATKHGVMVTNTPGVLDETTADFAFTLMMAAARRVVQADNFVRAGNFKGWALDMMLGQDVHDVGLAGPHGIATLSMTSARHHRHRPDRARGRPPGAGISHARDLQRPQPAATGSRGRPGGAPG